MAEDELQVKCVEPAEGVQKSSSLQTVFDTLKDQSFTVSWLSQERCLQMDQRERNMLFVMDPFEGPAFHHLASLRCRVVGPQCVLSTLLLKISVPRRRQPIYNLAMKDLCVCCTSVEKAVREKVYKNVEMMGGIISKDLTDLVTHLVVGEVGSQKYQVAAANGRRIMTPEWVEAVWERSQYRHVHASDEQFQKYRCKVFRGVSVTVSGLISGERRKIKEAVEAEGGRYSGDLKVKECTHLIVPEPKGEKYQHAKLWQIHIVRPAWVTDSVEKGFCQPECKYHLKSGNRQDVKTSTPERDTSSGREFGDISAISLASVSNMASTVNETRGTGQTTFRASLDANSSTTGSRGPNSSLPNPEGDPDLSLVARDLLEGCRVYVSGFTGDDFERLCKIVNSSGGLRMDNLNKQVTHVVLGEMVPNDVNILHSGHVNAHVVSAAWLLDSLHQGRLLKESDYYKGSFPVPKLTSNRKSDPEAGLLDSSAASAAGKTSAAPAPEPASAAADQSSRQSEASQGDTTMRPCQDEVDGDVGGKVDQEVHGNQEEILEHYMTLEEGEEVGNPSDEAEENAEGIFRGKTFRLFGFDEEQLAELVAFITENGGAVKEEEEEEEGDTADYGIVPITGFPVPPRAARQLLTNAWLQMCIEEEALLPVGSNRLFRPMAMEKSSLPLKGCVLSVSGYSGTERDCLIHIAELLGSNCQEFFVRKPKKNLEASTHLVCKLAEGSKYDAAKKWGLPAITKHWLFACVDTDRRAPEEDYLVENADQSNLPGDETCMTTDMQAAAAPEDKPPAPAPAPSTPTAPAPATSTSASDGRFSAGEKKETRLSLNTRPANRDLGSDVKNASFATAGDGGGVDGDDTVWGKSAKSNASLESSGVVTFGSKKAADESAVSVEPAASNTDLGSHKLDGAGEDGNNEGSRDSGLGQRHCVTAQSEAGEAFDIPAGAVPTSSTENTQCERRGDSNPMSGALSLVDRGALLKESQRENRQQLQVTPTAPARPQHSRVKELQGSCGQRTPCTAASPCSAGVDTPGQFLAEGKKYIPHFNLKNALADLESPVAAEHRRRSSLGLDQVFPEAVAAGVKTSAITRKQAKGSSGSQLSNSQEEEGPLQGVIISVSKKLASKQTEYNEIVKELGGSYIWSYNSSCTHFIFQGRANDMSKEFRVARDHGVKIVCPQWLLMCKESRAWVDESLFPHNYNPHLALSCVTPGGVRRSARAISDPSLSSQKRAPGSVKKRRLQTEPVPFREPVLEAPETKRRAASPPASAPAPAPAPTLPSSPPGGRAPSSGSDSAGDASPPQVEEAVAVEEVMMVEVESGGTLEMREALQRQVEDLMANSAKAQKNRRKTRPLDCNSSGNTSTGSPESRRLSRPKQDDAAEPERPEPNSLPEGSQFVQVSWDDPVRRMEQERMAAKLQEACLSSQSTQQNTDQFLAVLDIPDPLSRSRRHKQGSTPDPSTSTADEGSGGTKSAEPVKSPPIFIVSSMQQNERTEFAALVVRLGGQLLDKQYFDPSCTHLVVGVPGRNEKFLAAVASGRWVLHKSYFEECRKEGRFVREEPFEWGAEGTKALTTTMNPSLLKLVAAAHRWRQTVSLQKQTNPGFQGAFDGWRVLLCTDKNKEGSFLRLLQAGGATIIPFSSPIPKDINATHAFLDLEKRPLPQEDLETLLLAEVHCLKPDFIASHLMEDPPPSPPDFYPPQITALLVSLSESNVRKRKPTRLASEGSKRTRRQ